MTGYLIDNLAEFNYLSKISMGLKKFEQIDLFSFIIHGPNGSYG